MMDQKAKDDLEPDIKKLKTAIRQLERIVSKQQREIIAVRAEIRELINRQERSTKR